MSSTDPSTTTPQGLRRTSWRDGATASTTSTGTSAPSLASRRSVGPETPSSRSIVANEAPAARRSCTWATSRRRSSPSNRRPCGFLPSRSTARRNASYSAIGNLRAVAWRPAGDCQDGQGEEPPPFDDCWSEARLASALSRELPFTIANQIPWDGYGHLVSHAERGLPFRLTIENDDAFAGQSRYVAALDIAAFRTAADDAELVELLFAAREAHHLDVVFSSGLYAEACGSFSSVDDRVARRHAAREMRPRGRFPCRIMRLNQSASHFDLPTEFRRIVATTTPLFICATDPRLAQC